MSLRFPAYALAAIAAFATAAGIYAAVAADETVQGGPIGSADLACDVVGTPAQPIDEFVSALAPNQTACLREGVHRSQGDIKVTARDVVLSSYPGEQAAVEGRLWIAAGADGVRVENLVLNGRNPDQLPSPTVNANDVVFRNNEVTNEHTAICFVIGDDEFGEASETVIAENRIHGCGELPPTNHDHGIYVAHADGTQIRSNLIYSNADRGIQLYPDADRTRITGNVIDGNGQGIIFGGNGDEVSEGNLVEHNLITNSQVRFNVESNWPGGAVGRGNVVRQNCIWGGERDTGDGGIETPPEGFQLADNLIADPLYVDREAEDFRLDEDSPCANLISAAR